MFRMLLNKLKGAFYHPYFMCGLALCVCVCLCDVRLVAYKELWL